MGYRHLLIFPFVLVVLVSGCNSETKAPTKEEPTPTGDEVVNATPIVEAAPVLGPISSFTPTPNPPPLVVRELREIPGNKLQFFDNEGRSNEQWAKIVQNAEIGSLHFSEVKDVAPLEEHAEQLIGLRYIAFSELRVSDISPLARSLAKLPNLERLSLHNTQVTDLSPLAELSNLKTLYFDGTTRGFDLSSLLKLSNLESLDLTIAQVGDLSLLTELSNLESLAITVKQSNDSDLSSLVKSLTKLPIVGLSFYGTKVSDITSLARLTKLKRLHLSKTQVSDLSPLAKLRNLEKLDLVNTLVTDLSPLAELTNLTWLHVGNTDVSDLSPLTNLTKLAVLNCSGTRVSKESILQLNQALPNLNERRRVAGGRFDYSGHFHSGMSALTGKMAIDGYSLANARFSTNGRDTAQAFGVLFYKKENGVLRRWGICEFQRDWVSCSVLGDIGVNRDTLFSTLREEWKRLDRTVFPEDMEIGVDLIDSIANDDIEKAEVSSTFFNFIAVEKIVRDGTLLTIEFTPK